MGTLYVVATPIGNLRDLSFRALEILKSVAVILAEDTRVTKKLCAHYRIETPIERYDANVGLREHAKVKAMLTKGWSVALVTDAGTPAISDPGGRLVSFIAIELPDTPIVPIPGPSAISAILSVAGVSADQFTFLGYPPHRKGRDTFFKNLATTPVRPVVLYESPHRIEKTLTTLTVILGDAVHIVVGRELTKVYEEVYRGTLRGAHGHFIGEHLLGEFVIVIP